MRFAGFAFSFGTVDVKVNPDVYIDCQQLVGIVCRRCGFTCPRMYSLDCKHMYCYQCILVKKGDINQQVIEAICNECNSVRNAEIIQLAEEAVANVESECPLCLTALTLQGFRRHLLECKATIEHAVGSCSTGEASGLVGKVDPERPGITVNSPDPKDNWVEHYVRRVGSPEDSTYTPATITIGPASFGVVVTERHVILCVRELQGQCESLRGSVTIVGLGEGPEKILLLRNLPKNKDRRPVVGDTLRFGPYTRIPDTFVIKVRFEP